MQESAGARIQRGIKLASAKLFDHDGCESVLVGCSNHYNLKQMSASLGLTFAQKLPRIVLDSPQSQRCPLLSVLGGIVDQWRNLGPVHV